MEFSLKCILWWDNVWWSRKAICCHCLANVLWSMLLQTWNWTLFVRNSKRVSGTYIWHHFNGTELHYALSTIDLHHALPTIESQCHFNKGSWTLMTTHKTFAESTNSQKGSIIFSYIRVSSKRVEGNVGLTNPSGWTDGHYQTKLSPLLYSRYLSPWVKEVKHTVKVFK